MFRVTVKHADGFVSHVDFAKREAALSYFLSQSDCSGPKDMVCLDRVACERSRDGQAAAAGEQ